MFQGCLAAKQSPSPSLFGCVNKVGSLPSAGVMLSRSLNRYYEPLRLPVRARRAFVALYASVDGLPTTPKGLQHWTTYLSKHTDPVTPRANARESFRCYSAHPTAFPFSPQGRRLQLVDEATFRFTYRYGLLFCQLRTHDTGFRQRRSLELPRRTDNSSDGTRTR